MWIHADFACISPLSPLHSRTAVHLTAHTLSCPLLWFAMHRPVLVTEVGEFGADTLVMPLGARAELRSDADIGFLQVRFPGICPHHLLYNLLQLHYGRHPMCTARPFSNEQCQHGSHQKPLLSEEQMRSTAPAEGANMFLPFGLSCRNCDDDVGLVAGCADCETLEPGDTCGSCRRLWLDNGPVPSAAYFRNLGGTACLEGWLDATGLPAQAETWPEEEQEEEEALGEEEHGEEEWCAEEEWGEEEEGDEEAEAEGFVRRGELEQR